MAPVVPRDRPVPCWQTPPQGVVKISFNGSVFESRSELGVDVIARDEVGDSLAWHMRNFKFPADPSFAESLAAKEALKLVIQEGWRNVILEGDFQTVINRMASIEDNSLIGPATEDIQHLVRSIPHCIVEYIPREVNSLDHKLARRAVWNEDGINHFSYFLM
ncbi:hypothetical protein Salat_0169000 [Sesamum alatum]|uniref:RNase H type-1 domain-containing protein n=1 Tax=Sesamum alatum TaxID=300844 RepID=A0AAE2CXM1_9LAMI|nr:hypothetical protein Salat_0169000 [Sesamum alatum]